MTAEVEGEVLLIEVDRPVVTICACLFELGDRVVDALDIGRMMFAVVKFVDLPRDVGFKPSIVVIQVWQGVFSHEIPSSVESIGRRRKMR